MSISTQTLSAEHPSVPNSYALHSLMKGIHAHLASCVSHGVQAGFPTQKLGSFYAAMQLVENGILSIELCITQCNNGILKEFPAVCSAFFKACNVLQGVDFGSISHRHLRMQARATYACNSYIAHYCNARRAFLTQADYAIFCEMMYANQIILFCCLHGEYWNLAWTDKASDVMLFLPGECVYRYRWPILGAVACLIAGVGLYYALSELSE